MVSRLTHTHRSSLLSIGLVVVAIVVFSALISKHYEIEPQTVRKLADRGENALVILGNRIGLLESCGADEEFTTFSPTVYVCNNTNSEVVYDVIYTTYPAAGGGRESVYTFLNDGSRARADEMLQDTYFIERYEPVTLTTPLTWTEDPFNERYWRFLFYSLRPTRHLLAAADETGDERYYEKLREIISSFLTTGVEQQYAWDDEHGVAFRTMVLVNTWWKLREAGELSNELSDAILASLEEHGDFLLAPEHYEAGNNHAITQATALLVLAHNFPDLANAPVWRQTAIERIDAGLQDIIDEDGVLIENSPYYHFYVLEKYWEIRKYTDAQDIEISDTFDETVDRMIEFATYVLTPARQPPLLGASVPREISRSGEFREIAQQYPQFNYVLTGGSSGTAPDQRERLYPSSGIALLRSGWGTERPYDEELFVLFDTGPYRTDHSDYDALTFSLYAAGTPIVRDSGLFTYESDHEYFEYFHGTNGHNTVMVDEQDQTTGGGRVGDVASHEEYGYVTAQHTLYPTVTHHRSLLRIEAGAVLVVDQLTSPTTHRYEQLFHLSEHAELTNDTSAIVEGFVDDSERTPFSIEQFGTETERTTWYGDGNAVRGFCAIAYEEAVPCHELSFATNAPTARYVTLIAAGAAGTAYSAHYDDTDSTLTITTGSHTYTIDITFPAADEEDSYITFTVDARMQEDADRSFFESIQAFFKRLF